jgi:hypothetical protein
MEFRAKTNVVNVMRGAPVVVQVADVSFLYLPVDQLGSAVEPKRAIRLECWRYTGERRQNLYVADSLKHALIRKDADEHYHLLYETFPLLGDQGIPWLTCIHRCVEGDVQLPKFCTMSPT